MHTMHIPRSIKLLIGILTIGQLFAVVALFVWMFTSLLRLVISGQLEQEPTAILTWFSAFFIGILLMVFLSLALLLFYIIHTAGNQRLNNTMKIVWVVLHLLFGAAAQVLYFFMEVLSDRSITARLSEPGAV
jgi:hypothetical protein